MSNSRPNTQRGQVLIMATVFFVTISTAVMLTIGSLSGSSQELANRYLESRKSFYIAEAGLESAIYDRIHGQPLTPAPVIDGVQASVSVDASVGEERIISTARWNNAARTVEATLSVGSTTDLVGWKESQ